MPNSLKNKKNSGFTLVELALVLVIAGLLLSLAASVGAARIDGQRIKDTNARMNFIMAAIKQYVRNYKHLPCPASLARLESETTFFGYGTGTNTVDPATNATCTAANAGTGNVEIGAVPIRELGISPAVTVDGWGNRIVYAVDFNLTSIDRDIVPTSTTACGTDGAIGPGFTNVGTTGGILVEITASGADVSSTAAVLMFSSGPNGNGAWGAALTARALACNNTNVTDGDERENCDDADVGFVQKFPTSTFDDIVVFAEKWQLPWVCEQ